MHLAFIVLLILALASVRPALAHGGGLDANGCHTNRKTGDYHCHRSPGPKPRSGTDDLRRTWIDPRRPRAYVQNAGNAGISVINTLTDRVIDTIDIGHATNALALDPASRRLYVGNDDGTLSVIGTANDADAVLANIPVGSGISDLAVDPGRHRAYVADFVDNTVAEVDTRANVVLGSTPVGIDPEGIAVDTTSGREFVASYSADYVSVLGE